MTLTSRKFANLLVEEQPSSIQPTTKTTSQLIFALLTLASAAGIPAETPRELGAKTTVEVFNNHTNDITYRLDGAGVGACGGQNQPLQPGHEDPDSWFCSWGTLNYRFTAYDATHVDDLPLCETTDIGNCYAHTEAGLKAGYACTVLYEGETDGVASAACSCKIVTPV